MSATIDNRVVEMRFDNKHFESNVQTSLGTLEKLKQSLNLSGASKGLDNISSAAKRFDMSGMGNAVEGVRLKFSALEVMAVTALGNITNSAVNAGKRIVSALTIAPIKSGFEEYETQINAVQTILANTEHKGTTLDQVNSALDELNTYADKTIYNFTQMTRNIGTFTAAGVDLDKSVTSIKGIANLAAVSGSTSQQASTAMYQLSQALAAGRVSLMDWNSVVNAGMGGQVFQNALKRTATQMGYNVDEIIKKYGSFRESLTQGEWLTAEVLTETLTQLSGAYSKADLIAQGYSESQAEEIVKLSETAENAATKVKTFTQLIDTTKESLQSGWTQTWELLIGDFDQAKNLWTGVSDALGGFINKSSESRNKLLEGAMTSNWDKLIKRVNEAGITTDDFEERVRNVAKGQGVDLDKLIDKYGSLEEVFRSGAASSDILTKAVGKVNNVIEKADFSLVDRILGRNAKGEDVKQVEKALASLGYNLTGKDGKDYSGDGYFGTLTEEAVKAFQKTEGLKVTGIVDEETLNALEKATSKTSEFTANIDDLIGGIDELGGRELLIESFKNIFSSLAKIGARIKKAFTDIFPPMTSEQLYGLIEGFKAFTDKLKPTQKQCAAIYQTFKGLFSAIDIVLTVIKELAGGFGELLGSVLPGFADGVLGITGSFGSWVTGLRDSIKETDIFGKAVDTIVGFLQKAIDKIKSFGSTIKEKLFSPGGFDGFFKVLKGVWGFISNIGKGIGEIISKAFEGGDIEKGLDILQSGLFAGILLSVKKFIDGFNNEFGAESIVEKLSGFVDGIKDVFDSLGESLQSWQQNMKAGTLMKIAAAIGILAISIVAIASIDPTKLASSLWTITALFGELLGSMALFDKIGGTYSGAFKATGLLISMSVAILILAGAVKTLSSLNWEELAKGLVGVGALMAEMAAFLAVAKLDGKTFSTAVGMVVLASAIKILASACKDFGQMNWEEIGKGLASIGGLLAELAIFTNLTGNAKHVISTGVALVLIGASMKIFASAVKDFSGMQWEELGRGLAGMAGALIAVALATRLMPKNIFGIGIGLVVIASSLIILSNALEKMSGMTWDEIGRGLAVLGGSLLILAVALNLMKSTLAGSAALLIAAGALAILAPVLKVLGGMSWESIAKGLVAVAGAFAILGIAGLLLGPLTPVILALSGALALAGVAMLAFGVGVGVLAAGLGVLVGVVATGATAITAAIVAVAVGIGQGIVEIIRTIGDSATAIGEAFKAIVLTLVDVIVECAPAIAEGALTLISEVLSSLANHTPEIVESLFQFILSLLDGISARLPELIQSLLDVFTSLFTGVFDALAGLDTSTLLQTITGVGMLAGIIAALSMISGFIPGAMVGVVGMGAVAAELALVIAALGALAQIPGLDWLISEGATFIQNIGNAIGGFVGGIVGGIAEGITASLPQIGTDLSTFMTNLQPFIDGAKLIDESMMTGVQSIVDIITTLTGASLLEGITSFITGSSSMSTFATELASFGDGLKGFADKVVDIDPTSITAAVTAAQGLATMANSIPNEGGLLALFSGDNTMSSFATQLPLFADGIKGFADNVSGIKTDSIAAATTAASSLVELANLIPNEGGLLSLFSGDNTMSSFATQLPLFGSGIKGFGDEVADIDTAAVSTAVTAANSLVTLANNLPESGGLWSVFSGDNDLSTFASELKKFGSGIYDFSEEVAGINTVAIGASIAAVTRIANIATKIPEGGYPNLKTFGEQMKTFGGKFEDLASDMTSIDTASLSTAITSFNSLVATLASASQTDFSSLSTFGTTLGDIGKDGVDKFVKAFANAKDTVSKTGKDLMTNLVDGVKGAKDTLSTACKTLADSCVTALRSKYSSFKSAGGYLVDGFAAGISENAWRAAAKAAAMASAALEAAKEELVVKSPSRKFYEIGRFAVLGLANALVDYSYKAYNAGAYMASSAKNGLSKAISRVGDIVTNGIDTQPTIRPVVDLTDVTNGANAINGMLSMQPSLAALSNVGAINSMMNRRQNGTNNDVISAIKDLGKKIGNTTNNYNVNGVSYNDGSEVGDAIATLVRAVTVERRT